MKKLEKVAPASDLIAIGDIEKLVRKVRHFIWAIGSILVFFFAWVQFKEIPVGEIIENTRTGVILSIVLAVYYSCWIFGTGFDLSIQQAVYINDPYRGRMPMEAYFLLVGFGIVAGILLWASTDNKYFAAALSGFTLSNIFGWMYIIKRVKPIIASSRSRYIEIGDFFGLERLKVVVNYMTGSWQWHRFIVMCLLILVTDLLVFLPAVRHTVGVRLNAILSSASPDSIDRILPELMFAVFVIVAESWIMTMRMRTKSLVDTLNDIRKRYELKPLR